MGTRADFYVGAGENAEWLGSVAWDGYEWDEDKDCPLMKATTEEEYRTALTSIAKERDDWTNPEQGWPWPWEDSGTTDYAYYFKDGKVSTKDRRDWPNMKDRMYKKGMENVRKRQERTGIRWRTAAYYQRRSLKIQEQ